MSNISEETTKQTSPSNGGDALDRMAAQPTQQSNVGNVAADRTALTQQPSEGDALDRLAAQHQQQSAQPVEPDPGQTGEIVNDVGNTVIVPKDGESFADTMKRAVAYHNSLTPEQRQAAINSEIKTMPGKVATTLAAAPVIGAAGVAGGAAVNEVATALPSVIPHTIAGVKAVGAWANANPIQAYLLYNVLKELIPGAKKTMGIIKGAPDVE
jgi:hypothetical protein